MSFGGSFSSLALDLLLVVRVRITFQLVSGIFTTTFPHTFSSGINMTTLSHILSLVDDVTKQDCSRLFFSQMVKSTIMRQFNKLRRLINGEMNKRNALRFIKWLQKKKLLKMQKLSLVYETEEKI